MQNPYFYRSRVSLTIASCGNHRRRCLIACAHCNTAKMDHAAVTEMCTQKRSPKTQLKIIYIFGPHPKLQVVAPLLDRRILPLRLFRSRLLCVKQAIYIYIYICIHLIHACTLRAQQKSCPAHDTAGCTHRGPP